MLATVSGELVLPIFSVPAPSLVRPKPPVIWPIRSTVMFALVVSWLVRVKAMVFCVVNAPMVFRAILPEAAEVEKVTSPFRLI